MPREPVLSGDIPPDGFIDVLREIEDRRITGKIRFIVGDESGEVELVQGQLALDQEPLPDGADPVEALLAARAGLFTVHALLPPLPVSRGDESERRGSLGVHPVTDLMTYCEQAGLTGWLELRNAGRVVEMIYEAGELLGICLDGREETELDAVFAWEDGSFHVTMHSVDEVRARLPGSVAPPPTSEDRGEERPGRLHPPTRSSSPSPRPRSVDPALPSSTRAPLDPSEREPTVRFERAIHAAPAPKAATSSDGGPTSRYAKVGGREDTGRNFLRVVEMALTDVTTARNKARPSTKSFPKPKQARPSMRPAPASPARRKDATVRIVWVGGEPAIEGELEAKVSPLRAPPPPSLVEPSSSEPPSVEPSPVSSPIAAPVVDPSVRTPTPARAPEADARSSWLIFGVVLAAVLVLGWLSWAYLLD